MQNPKNRPLLAVVLSPEISGAHGEAKTAYNLWLGGIDSVSAQGTEETEALRIKAQLETGEGKEIRAHAGTGKSKATAGTEKTKNKSPGSAVVAENLQGLFALAKEGRAGIIDVSAIIARNAGDEILAAKACRQCVNAALSGIALENYAKMHSELAVAISREKK
ncbi:MAG: hypothetical protein V1676_07610 [Candidatus Diapherotrites archaeon]